MYSIQHYAIKLVSDLRQVGGFIPGTPVSSTNKTDHHDMTEILLKVALNTINQTNQTQNRQRSHMYLCLKEDNISFNDNNMI